MRLYLTCPQTYKHNELAFLDDRKTITSRIRAGLENVLHAYSSKVSKEVSVENQANYEIKKVLVIGSTARENKVKSDLDLILTAPKVSADDAKEMKLFLSYAFFCDRPKEEAIDLYINENPRREFVDITEQVANLLKKYNGILAGVNI